MNIKRENDKIKKNIFNELNKINNFTEKLLKVEELDIALENIRFLEKISVIIKKENEKLKEEAIKKIKEKEKQIRIVKEKIKEEEKKLKRL